MDASELETLAWHRARIRRLLEAGAAVLSAGFLAAMVTVFYSILTH
jgi:hypothetical protein